MILDMALKFEMGLREPFFNFGFSMACLSCVGMFPDWRDMLTISVSTGRSVSLQLHKTDAGIGISSHDFRPIALT